MSILATLLFFLFPAASIHITVRAEGTGTPVARATVQIPELGRSAVTDGRGAFVLPDVQPGRWMVRVSAPGLRAHEVGVQVPASGSVRLDFDLTPERQAKALLRGRVTGAEGEPLADAVVEVMHTYWRTQSRPNGAFEIPVPPGTWRLRTSKIGYRPDTLSITTGEAVSGAIQARLEPLVLELRGISVQAARTPALGQTVTSSTVRQVPPLGEPDIFRAVVLLPGV